MHYYRTGQVLFKLTSFNNYPLGDGLGRSQLVRLVSLNQAQPVLSQIFDHRPLSVKQWNHNVSYQDLLQLSVLPSLAIRRKYLNLCYFYKVVHNIFDFPNPPLTARTLNYLNCNGRTDLYVQPQANSNTLHHSYFPATTKLCNSLPPNVIAATTVYSFQTQLRNTIF